MYESKRTKIVLFFVGLAGCIVLGVLIAPFIRANLWDTVSALSALEGYSLSITPYTIKAALCCAVIYILVYLAAGAQHKATRQGEEHGSARWQNAVDVCRAVSSKDYDKNRILSQNVRIAVSGKTTLASLNSFVVGGMGMGKSYYFVIPNILQAASSIVVTDPSGELAARTGSYLKDQGIAVKVVDIEHLESSLRYNFFRYIKSEADILEIVDIIFAATAAGDNRTSNDPMWDNLAKDRLAAYIGLLWLSGDIQAQNMDTVIWLFEQDATEENKDGSRKENGVSAEFAKLERMQPGNFASSKYLSSTRGAAVTIRGVESSLSGRLGRFMIPSVRSFMQTDELELDKIGTEKTALFLVIPSENKSFNFIISMIYAQIFRTLYAQARKSKDNKLAVSVQFFLDEMANVVLPKDFTTYLTTGRKHGISFVGILQDFAQAEKIFPGKVYETVIGTSSSFMYLGGSGKHTDEYISQWIGTQTITVTSQSVSYGARGHSSTSYQQQARPLMRAEELSQLPANKCVIYVQGQGWIMDSKYNPRTHPCYKQCADMTGDYYEWMTSGEAALTQLSIIDSSQKVITINADEISTNSLAEKYDIFWED